MPDTREAILARIVEIMKTVPGIKTVVRNEIDLSRKDQPAATLLDGDEEVYTRPRVPSQILAPQIMRMRFGLFITVKDARPKPNDMGTVLNGLRIAAIKALTADVQLRTLIGTNGALEFTGINTDLNVGSAISGEMQLNFTANYFFDPATA